MASGSIYLEVGEMEEGGRKTEDGGRRTEDGGGRKTERVSGKKYILVCMFLPRTILHNIKGFYTTPKRVRDFCAYSNSERRLGWCRYWYLK